jgi:hypothetical protein
MKTSRKLMITNRLSQLKRRIKIDTQKIRGNAIQKLEELFNLAVSLARGKFETQTVDGRTMKVTLKQRQLWARVAAYIAQIMNSLAEGFDEREMDVQLDELERLVNEAREKAQNGKTEEGTKSAEEKGASTEPG